ncbi:MAG: LptA/OstA family protein [Verrucomicrobiales bacterium]|nr:LptA/OstA family protein [Verrucomicrobiales bacterium]
MNPNPAPKVPVPADEAFIHAALHEKARLHPSKYDETLVRNILLETVERPVRAELTHSGSREDRKLWIIGTAAAAAVAVLFAGIFAALPFRDDRLEEEVLFIVQHGNEITEEETANQTTPAPSKAGQPYRGTLSLTANAPGPRASFSIPDSDLELTTIFGQSISEFSPRAVRRESFHIVADEISIEADEKVYTGNVILEYGALQISSEYVRVSRSDHGEMASLSGTVIAHYVTVHQQSPYRKIVAERLDFHPLTASLVLSGIRLFQSESEPNFPVEGDQRIILKNDELAVERAPADTGNLIKYANPLPKENKRK